MSVETTRARLLMEVPFTDQHGKVRNLPVGTVVDSWDSEVGEPNASYNDGNFKFTGVIEGAQYTTED